MEDLKHTPGPWEYVPSTEHHGPYVSAPWGGDVCDCYVMSNPRTASVRNGGTSYPINHQGERADANARLIAAAPEMFEALTTLLKYEPAEEKDWAKARAALAKARGEP